MCVKIENKWAKAQNAVVERDFRCGAQQITETVKNGLHSKPPVFLTCTQNCEEIYIYSNNG